MTTERQRAANTANARKSTGPKTAAGKAKVAGNAVSHGLTMPPPRHEVLAWLRIILDDPEANIGAGGPDPLGVAALALAEAEAHLERTVRAERDAWSELARFAKSHKEPDALELDLRDFDDPAVLEVFFREWEDRDRGEIFGHLLKVNKNRLPALARRLETMSRYVRRAEGRKRRAFATWKKARRAAA